MRYRNRLVALAVFAATAMTVFAQQPAAKTATASKTWKQPETPWGDPDLQGVWPSQNMIGVPMERDPKLGTRAVLTEAESAQRSGRALSDFSGTLRPEGKFSIAGGWAEKGRPNLQASLVIDPPDGRIPALSAEGQAREDARKKHWNEKRDSPDTWMDLTTWDRCITKGPIGSVIPNVYDDTQEIVQAPGYVVFRNEMIHEARVIPLDGRPHASPEIKTYMGDSRGHWEGKTLVVETTNFNGQFYVGGGGGGFGEAGAVATEHLRLIERFTRTDQDTVVYQATVEDPHTWTAPWTISIPLKREPGENQILEYACHEGNYFMHDVLAGARADEKKAAQAGAQK
jgi:hypothetical protein